MPPSRSARVRPRAHMYRAFTALVTAVCATLAFAGVAQAASTNTLPPQNITTTSASLEGTGVCNAGTTCKAFFHWHQTSHTWYNAAVVTHTCAGSSPCTWTQAAPLSGLLSGTNYTYTLCSEDASSSYACVGPTGTTTSMQPFTTGWPVPTNVSAPGVSGTATEYDTLYETHGSWTSRPTGYSYQWMDCDSSGGNCVAIPGATSSSYILGAGDVGETVEVQESAVNSGGTSTPATSAPTPVVGANSVMTNGGALTFDGTFANLTPWKTGGGSAQCANYGTPS